MVRKRILTDEERMLWEKEKKSDLPIQFTEKNNKDNVDKTIRMVKKCFVEIPYKQNRLDLHGMTAEKAHKALASFINTQFLLQNRKLLVITGKGSGMLRDALPKWLSTDRFTNMVSSCVIAKVKDGGDGAYYVTLRKIKTQN